MSRKLRESQQATRKANKKRRRPPTGPGYTCAQFAELPEVDSTPTVIRSAIKRGDIKAIPFNGILRIPPSERDRYVETWGSAKQAASAS